MGALPVGDGYEEGCEADVFGAWCERVRIDPALLDARCEGPFTRKRIASCEAAGIAYPDRLHAAECLLVWTGGSAEGVVTPRGAVGEFRPFDAATALPSVGTEVRLRQAEGSARVIVLQSGDGVCTLAKAPNRIERRKHERVPARGVAVVRLGASTSGFDLFDISEGGVAVDAPFPIEVGENVHILLRVEGKKRLPLECDGVVASCRQVVSGDLGTCRIGIKFTDLPETAKAEIRRMIRDAHR